MYSSVISYSLLLLTLLSCNSKNRNYSNGESHSFPDLVFLEKLDSIQIGYLGNPTVHDLDPTNKTVVLVEHRQSSEEIFIADFSGSILSSFSKFGDKPDTYGKLFSTIRIVSDNSLLVYGYNGFITYDYSGFIKSLVKSENFQVPSQSMIAMGFGMEKLGDRYLHINQAQPPKQFDSDNTYFLFNILNPKNGKIEPAIHFPESSMFTSGKHFFMRSWFPVYDLSGDRIYIVLGSEPVIYAYESEYPYSLASTITLKLDNYYNFKGADYPNDEKLFGMSMISGRIDNIKKIDDYFLISYFPGYDKGDIEANFENKSPEEAKVFRANMIKKYPSRITIVDSHGNVLNDFVPDGLEPSSMLSRAGQIWMMEKSDEKVEKDYFRLFRVGLNVEKN